MTFQLAQRKALPALISLAGRSGSGKTLSALLMARGLVGPDGKIFVIDTERGRASIYADDADVAGFQVAELHPPFTAARFIELIEAAQAAGADAIVVDSMSHEWSGLGGAIDQAQAADPTGRKGPTAWIKPKLAHKRLVNAMGQCGAHIIVTLRADHKLVTYKDAEGKQQFGESEELVPEQEKKFIYEMTISATIDLASHVARFTKLPRPLVGALADKMIDVASGKVVRDWIRGGAEIDPEIEREKAIARDLAGDGTAALQAHWKAIGKERQRVLKPFMEEMKSIARAADEIGDDPFAGEPLNSGGNLDDETDAGASPAGAQQAGGEDEPPSPPAEPTRPPTAAPAPAFRLYDEDGKTSYPAAGPAVWLDGILATVERIIGEGRSPLAVWEANRPSRDALRAMKNAALLTRLGAIEGMVLQAAKKGPLL